MSAADEIRAALAAINEDREEQRWRDQYRAAMRVLRTIPNDTRDEDLTPEQRQAWADHDTALEWIRSH